MAEEQLVAATLPPDLVSAGGELLGHLDQSGFPVNAALWVLVPESGQWRLLLASPEVRLAGARRAYRKVLASLNKLNNAAVSLANVSVVDSRDSLVNLLKVALKTGPGISGVRFSGITINGVRFPDAYVYRVT